MIKKVTLENFFSFQHAEINLHPEANVLVGINGSGKSNLLKAFRLLEVAIKGGLRRLIYDQWGGFDAIKFKGTKEDTPIRLTFHFDHEAIRDFGFDFLDDVFYRLVIHKVKTTDNYYLGEWLRVESSLPGIDSRTYLGIERGTGHLYESEGPYDPRTNSFEGLDDQEINLAKIYDPDRYAYLNAIRKAVERIKVYDYFDTTPNGKMRRPVIATSEQRLSSDGANLVQLLNTIKINDKAAYTRIIELLKEVNGKFSGLDFNFIGGNIELMLEEAEFNSAIHVTHVSDGTLRQLCLLAIFMNENRGAFVCIDEPELGLHPDMIKTIYDGIQSSSDTTQYLITTHSDHLLDLFELENILVIERDNENASVMKRLSAEAFEGWYDTFIPGRMWRLGDFGGNRY